MKKLLTLVLCVAVVFTFSFSSAFAANEYTEEQWQTQLDQAKDSVLQNLNSVKTAIKADFVAKQNNKGYVPATFLGNQAVAALDDDEIEGYKWEAVEAGIDKVISDVTKAMNTVISNKINNASFPESAAADTTDVIACGTAYETKAKMYTALDGSYEAKIIETQVDLTKADVLAEFDALDASKYNDEDKDYDYTTPSGTIAANTYYTKNVNKSGSKLTAAQVVQAIRDDARTYVNDASVESSTDAQKLAKYEAAYAAYLYAITDGTDGIPTKADEDFNNASDTATLSGVVDGFAKAGYDYAKYYVGKGTGEAFVSSDKADYTSKKTVLGANWEPNKSGSNDGELFGVKIENITKVTKDEAVAVYNAMLAQIDEAKPMVKTYLDKTTGKDYSNKLATLESNETTYWALIKKCQDAKDKYEDVVTEGNKLKSQTIAGVKTYDSTKVEEAVKKAEEFVYKDLNTTFDSAQSYIAQAANDIYDNNDGLDNLMNDEAKQTYNKFYEYVEDQIQKMWDTNLAYDGSYSFSYTPAKKVSYGSDATPAEDLVYLAETYDSEETTYNSNKSEDITDSDWGSIAYDAYCDLLDAQSYDEVDKIMAQAKEDFGKLLTKDNATEVKKNRTAYEKALKGYIEQAYQLLDKKSDYSDAYAGGTFDESPLYYAGCDLIENANTVDEVKAAYAEAQALVNNAKSNKELDSLKDGVEAAIDALPSTSKLTTADADKVRDAYKLLDEYYALPGAEQVTKASLLQTKYNKVVELLTDAIDDKAEELKDKIDDTYHYSDEGLAAYKALKSEMEALTAEGSALDDEVSDINDDAIAPWLTGTTHTYGNKACTGFSLTDVDFDTDYDAIDGQLGVDIEKEGRMYNSEINYAVMLLNEADKVGASDATVQKAIDAYNALTERQQLYIDQNYYYNKIIDRVDNKDNTAVKELKITAKSVAKKGSITVTWKVVGDESAADGYQVWKSTKHSKGYKKAFTTTNKSYKNTKGLKKGVRYYYKVRAYKVVDGKNVYSDWSNKARRIAK